MLDEPTTYEWDFESLDNLIVKPDQVSATSP